MLSHAWRDFMLTHISIPQNTYFSDTINKEFLYLLFFLKTKTKELIFTKKFHYYYIVISYI